MIRSSIVKISSAKGNCLGTGFVIDNNDNGVFVATCGHVVETCGEKNLLIEEQEAIVVKNYYNEGLDIAILYLPKVKIKPLHVVYDIESSRVKVWGFTSFGKDIKKEQMKNIEAKYEIEITNEKRKVEIVRLSPKEKITHGYSGSPVISESTGMVVGMIIVEAREQHTNYAISSKHILEVYDCPSIPTLKIDDELSEKNKKDKLSLNEWVGIGTIIGVVIALFAWIFPSPLSYFKDDDLISKEKGKSISIKDSNSIAIAQLGGVLTQNINNHYSESSPNKVFKIKIKEHHSDSFIENNITFFINKECTRTANYLGNNPKNNQEHLLDIEVNNEFMNLYMYHYSYGCVKLLFKTESPEHLFECYKDCSLNENSNSTDCVDNKEKGKCDE